MKKIIIKKAIIKKVIHSSIFKIAVLLILSFGVPYYIPLDGNDILTYNFALTTDIALFSLSLAITAIFFTVLDRYQQKLGNTRPEINSLINESLKEMGDNTLGLFFISFITFIVSLFQSVIKMIEKVDINTSVIIFSYLLTFLTIYDITKATVDLIKGISTINKV